MKVRPGIELAGATDIGRQRENNEDSYAYWEPQDDALFRKKGRLAIVADGMGGHQGGQEASRIAAETVQRHYAAGDGSIPADLESAFRAAHEQIREDADQQIDLKGMGTTCTAAVLQNSDLFYAHVGDSRLYLIQQEKIRRLTRDHSYVGRLVEQGALDPKDAETHPQRHVLTAALGAGEYAIPDVSREPIPLTEGDAVLLCTDGLWGLLSDEEMLRTVSGNPAEEACRELIDMACRRGGPDNITVQVLRITSELLGSSNVLP